MNPVNNKLIGDSRKRQTDFALRSSAPVLRDPKNRPNAGDPEISGYTMAAPAMVFLAFSAAVMAIRSDIMHSCTPS
jgi:hypothetical protein